MSVLDGLTEPPYGDDLAGAVYEEDEKTFVVEAKIMGISLLLPFPLNVSVGTVAEKAYDEFKAMLMEAASALRAGARRSSCWLVSA